VEVHLQEAGVLINDLIAIQVKNARSAFGRTAARALVLVAKLVVTVNAIDRQVLPGRILLQTQLIAVDFPIGDP